MRISFSQRIFGAMFLITLFTSLSVFFITIYHFGQQTKTYHEDRLKRKEERILATIDYELDQHPDPVSDEDVTEILRNKIHGIADINNQKINVFSLKGKMLLATASDEEKKHITISDSILELLNRTKARIEIPVIEKEDTTFLTTYSYLYNINRQPVAIVNLPYFSNNSFFLSEQNMLLRRFGIVMPIVLIIGGILAWFMSNNITKRLKGIANKMKNTQMLGDSAPIQYRENDEVRVIVDSYNEMVGMLREQSHLLARKEREEAWREMAKQVAHEVKNPLTPMKLLIQNFERRFDPTAEDAREKVRSISASLVNQIDTISNIAEAFSDFAKMPARKDVLLDWVATVEAALDIFPKNQVHFVEKDDSIYAYFDANYLVRIINNLVKNAIQAVPDNRDPHVEVKLYRKNITIVLTVSDNGTGIPKDQTEKVFEPKFTTKSSGMGLGLSMVKKIVEDYKGTIHFYKNKPHGTTFRVEFMYTETKGA